MGPIESRFECGKPGVSKYDIFMSNIGDEEAHFSANVFCLHI